MLITTLGLDLGIASIGWCLFKDDEEGNHTKIIDLGSFIFPQIEDGQSGKTENITRREKRSVRRQRRRKNLRLEDCRKLLKEELDIDFTSLKLSNYPTPMDLKIKGLHEKLTKEELSIALYHYLKYRGFKSNKKSEKPSDGVLSKKLSETEQLIKNSGKYVTEFVWGDYSASMRALQGKKYHNGSYYSGEKGDNKNKDSYNLNITRNLYLEEINALLDNQIKENVIDEEFKDKYISLFTRQRDFSDGPSVYSPWHRELKDLIGTCLYDNNERAPIDSYAFQLFKFLEKIVNLRYKIYQNGEFSSEYLSFNSEQINKLKEELFLKTHTISYKKIFSTLGIKENVYIKDLNLTKSEYTKINEKLDKNSKNYLEEKSNAIYEEKSIFKTSEFLKEYLDKVKKIDDFDLRDFLQNADIIDKLSRVSLIAKTDKKIEEEVSEINEVKERSYVKEVSEFVSGLQNEAKGVSNLSVQILNKINPIILKGKNYYDALFELGYTAENGETKNRINIDCKILPSIDEMLKGINTRLTNPVVKHTLVQLRTLLNEIIRVYGKPKNVCIEFGRELRKNFQDRKQIQNNQEENRYKNNQAKLEILENYKNQFPNFSSVKYDALLRYKLYKEQNEISPYTNERIVNPFDTKYEVDHIVPYSKSFDDSFNNKVLVEKIKNDEKGNHLPLEISSIRDEVKKFLQNNRIIKDKKRDNLLLKSFDSHENDFIEKDANDNSYIAKLARDLIETYVLDKGIKCRVTSGAITEKLRNEWLLGGKTHSFVKGSEFNENISKCYTYKYFDNYLYRKIEVTEKNNELSLTFDIFGEEVSYSIKKPELTGGRKEYSAREIKQINYLNKAINNIRFYQKLFDAYINQPFSEMLNKLSGNNDEINYLLEEIYTKIQDDCLKKDRSNNLHHALDAAIIGCVTPKIVQKISVFYENQEKNIDLKTGEIYSAKCPTPYFDFQKEVLLRVYERNIDVLVEELNKLGNYKEEKVDVNNVHVMVPVMLPNKDIKGAISEETIYGEKRFEGRSVLTKKVSVKSLSLGKNNELKEKQDIIDAYGSNNIKGILPMINAIEAWLKLETKKSDFPVLPKKGTPIKYVKKIFTNKPESMVNLGNGKFAKNSDCIKVMILKAKDNSYAMAPVYYYQIWTEGENARRIKEGKDLIRTPKYQVMWAQGDNNEYMNLNEIKDRYEIIGIINRNSLIKIKTNNGVGLAYTGGVTGGKLEIYSLLGDNLDLCNDKILNKSDNSQNYLTISTIKNIEIKNISSLGIIK